MARSSFCRSRVQRAVSALAAAIMLMVLAPTAVAHPGHGVTPEGDDIAHYLLEPMHGLGLVVLLILLLAAVVMLRVRTARSAP